MSAQEERGRWMKGFPCPSWLFHETLTAQTIVVVSVLRVPLPVKRRGGLAMRRRVVQTESASVVAGLSELLNLCAFFVLFVHLGVFAKLIAVKHQIHMNGSRQASLPVAEMVQWSKHSQGMSTIRDVYD